MDSASLAAMGYYAAEEDKLRRQRQEQSNPIDAIGKTALAAGAIAAAILGGRRLGGLKNTSSTVDLSTINPNTVRRAAGRPTVDIPETVVASRTPPPVVRTEPKSTLERLGDRNEFIRQAREERPQGITFVSQLGEEPTIVPTELILPKTTTTETPTAQGFGLDYLNTLLGKTSAPTQSTTSLKTVSQPRVVLDPFGSPTVPTVRSQETSMRGPRLLSPAAPDVTDRLLNDPYILKRVNAEQEAKELAVDNLLSSNRSEQARQQAQARRAITESGDEIISSLRSEANTAQAAAQGDYAQEYLKTAGYKDADTMVDLQVSNTPRNTDQTLNAIDAAEDQQTGRVYQQLQRNEDLDLNQIEIMEDMAQANRKVMMEGGEPTQMVGYEADASINQVASQLSDGLPIDQAEGASNAAQNFVSEALKKQRSPRAPLSDLDNKMYDLVATAAESGLKLEPNRALSILTDPNIELTTNEINLFRIDPKIGKFALKGQSYAPGQQQTGATLSLKGEQLESIPNIGLDPQSSITQPASGTSIRGRSRIQNEPEVFRQRRDSLGRPLTEDIYTVDDGGTLTMSTGKELTELDISKKFNEEDFPRSFARDPITGKRQPIYVPKGKRAVLTKEGKTYYVPIQDPGGIGIYGEERSYASGPLTKYDMPEEGRVAGEYTKAAMLRPTELPFKEKTPGGTGFSALNNEQLNAFILSEKSKGKVREAGMKELADRQAGARSILVSEALRRGNIEGRDPQMILKQFGIGV